MKKRSILISILSLLISLPNGALASSNLNQADLPISPTVATSNAITTNNQKSITTSQSLSDYQPPTLVSGEVSHSKAKVGDTITISVEASDDMSGLMYVNADMVFSELGISRNIPLTLDNKSGKWVATYKVNEVDPGGKWILYFNSMDNSGNYTHGNKSIEIEVDNPNGDTEKPVFQDVIFSKKSVNKDENFNIRVKATDNNEIVEAKAYLSAANGMYGGYYVPLSYDETTKEWVGDYAFGYEQMGEYVVNIELKDLAGNSTYEMTKKSILFTNPYNDFTAPTIGNVSISPNKVSPGDKITVSADLSDDNSGIKEAYVNLIDPNHNVSATIYLKKNETTGKWSGESDIQDNYRPGSWSIEINATDIAENRTNSRIENLFTVANEVGDFEPPIIKNIQVTKGTKNVGDVVAVTATVTDNKAGINNVQARISNGYESGYDTSMRYDSTKKQWVGYFTIKDTAKPGLYDVQVYANDKSQNYQSETLEDVFTVVNPDGDYEGPVISSVTLDKKEVNAGDQVKVIADVKDEKSGVAYVYVNLNIGFGSTYIYKQLPLKYNSTLKKWIGTIDIPKNATDGYIFSIDQLTAFDMQGNSSLDYKRNSVIVHNPDGDYTAPKLTSLQVSPTTAGVGQKIKIKAKITDDLTGVKSVRAVLSGPNWTEIQLEEDKASGLWVGNYTVKTFDKPGKYTVILDAKDFNGNSIGYEEEKNVTITNPKADLIDPEIGEVKITPQKAKVGDVVKIAATVTDSGSGVTNVFADLGYEGVVLDYNSTTKKWEGSYKVKETDSGKMTFYLYTQDRAGNYAESKNGFQLEVINSKKPDLQGPYVDFVTISKKTVKTGETIHIEAKLGDELSGVKEASVNWYGQMGSGNTVELKYKDDKQLWVADYTIPSYSNAGMHHVTINLMDNAGNHTYHSVYDQILVINDNPDDIAPKFEAVTISPARAKAGDVVTFKAKVSDNHSGVKEAMLTLLNPDTVDSYSTSDERAYRQIPLKYNSKEKLWVGTYKVLPTDIVGNWTIEYNVNDNANNFDWGTISKSLVVEKASATKYSSIKVQLNGKAFSDGYYGNKTTYVNWNALKTLKIPYTHKGNGVFLIAGETIVAESINGDWYIQWKQLAPGKVTYKEIQGGYDFIYTPPVTVQLNGKDFAQGGYFKNNTTFVNWNALKTLKIPYTHKGKGVFLIEGKTVQAEAINGDWYIQWKQLAPGKVTYKEIQGGYNFIYTPPVTVQLNGKDFAQGGYFKNNTTYVNWNALKTMKIPYTHKGKGVFLIEGKTVQAEAINGDWYIQWKQLAPGKVAYKEIQGGYNFIYTPPVKVQLNGKDFAQGGYFKNNTTYVNWNALKTLKIPYTHKGKGVFLIEGKTVQAESINGDWYIQWKQLAPGKVTYKEIQGGYNFVYTPSVKVQLNGKDFAQGGYFKNNTTYVNWNALKTLKIPYTYKGNGVFLIEGKTVQGESINGDWYIQWKQLAPGKVTYKEIQGGYNFNYNQK